MSLIQDGILLAAAALRRCQMIPRAAWLRLSAQAMLPIRSGQKLPQEPVFTHPPLWIHASGAAKCFQAADKAKQERKVPCSPVASRRSARS
jgi:hypothetical protein